jgi:hypothetical protein
MYMPGALSFRRLIPGCSAVLEKNDVATVAGGHIHAGRPVLLADYFGTVSPAVVFMPFSCPSSGQYMVRQYGVTP